MLHMDHYTLIYTEYSRNISALRSFPTGWSVQFDYLLRIVNGMLPRRFLKTFGHSGNLQMPEPTFEFSSPSGSCDLRVLVGDLRTSMSSFGFLVGNLRTSTSIFGWHDPCFLKLHTFGQPPISGVTIPNINNWHPYSETFPKRSSHTACLMHVRPYISQLHFSAYFQN